MHFAFNAYDFDSDGVIGRDDLTRTVDRFYRTNHKRLTDSERKKIVDKLNEKSKAKPELAKPFFVILWYLEYGSPPPKHVMKLVDDGVPPPVGGNVKPWQLALLGTSVMKAPVDPKNAAEEKKEAPEGEGDSPPADASAAAPADDGDSAPAEETAA